MLFGKSEHSNYFSRSVKSILVAVVFAVLIAVELLLLLASPPMGVDEASAAEPTNTRDALAARLAENVNISVPSRVNYVAKSDGTLLGPSAEALYLKNGSAYEIRVSSVRMDASGGWNFVDNISGDSTQNAVELSIMPKAETSDTDFSGDADIDAVPSSSATTISAAKTITSSSTQVVTSVDDAEPLWTMTAADANSNSADTQASELHFEIDGAVANMTASAARGAGTIGTTKWYVVADTVTDDFRSRISTLESQVATLQTEKTALENRVSTLETEKAAMATDLAAAQGNISSLQTAVGNSSSGLTKQVGDLTSALGNSSSGLTKRVGDAETDISNLKQSVAYTSGSLSNLGVTITPASGYSITASSGVRMGKVVFINVTCKNDTALSDNQKINFGTVSGITNGVISSDWLTGYLYSQTLYLRMSQAISASGGFEFKIMGIMN